MLKIDLDGMRVGIYVYTRDFVWRVPVAFVYRFFFLRDICKLRYFVVMHRLFSQQKLQFGNKIDDIGIKYWQKSLTCNYYDWIFIFYILVDLIWFICFVCNSIKKKNQSFSWRFFVREIEITIIVDAIGTTLIAPIRIEVCAKRCLRRN